MKCIDISWGFSVAGGRVMWEFKESIRTALEELVCFVAVCNRLRVVICDRIERRCA